MYLSKLQLVNFKNYTDESLFFQEKINVFVGPNGSGKTNLLDAIYYLALTKSAFQASDGILIRGDQGYFRLRGDFVREEKSRIVTATYQTGHKKSIKEDDIEYQRVTDHVGQYPVVLVAPDDTDLIRGASDLRRRFFDSIISQIDRAYLDKLIQYNHLLKQRNGLLKLFAETGRVDHTALDTYDESMDVIAQLIYEKRRNFISAFLQVFDGYFNFLVAEREEVNIIYKSTLSEKTQVEGLKANRFRDLSTLRTTFGVHRDEYEFRLGENDLRKFGSQGQQKSFVIGLKLAMWETIRQNKGFKPILLLDDIFDKLDDIRITKLLELVDTEFGQLFITDARPERTTSLLKKINSSVSIFSVESGKTNQHEEKTGQ